MPFVPTQHQVPAHARPEDLYAWDPSEGDEPKMRATLLNGQILALGARPDYASSPFPLLYRPYVLPIPGVIEWLEETWETLIENAAANQRALMREQQAPRLVKISLALKLEPVIDLSRHKDAPWRFLGTDRFKYKIMSPVRSFAPAIDGADY